MNDFDFDNGAAVALARLKTFSRPNKPADRPLCLGRNDQKRIAQNPAKRLHSKQRLAHLDRDALEQFKESKPPKWRAMYSAIEDGHCNQRFALGLLKLANLENKPAEEIAFEKYAAEIAVHEIAAFASSTDRRMQLRIKKNIPTSFFWIWDEGIQSTPESELIRFFRDAYLNLNASGLQHLGFYFIVFSKVTESQPAFETYLRSVDPIWRDLFRSFREASLNSSRKHIARPLASRIEIFTSKLEETT